MKILGKHNTFESLQNNIVTTDKLTPINGAPGATQFRSEIVGRAPINDSSKQLKSVLGVERIMFRSLKEISKETGPDNGRVYEPAGDERIRLYGGGSWEMRSILDGLTPISIPPGGNTEAYMEVIFYGTGLNLLSNNGNNKDIRATIDGGTESGDIYPNTGSAILTSRNYASNIMYSVAKNLSLGWHTARFRWLVGGNSPSPIGIEIVNESSQLSIGSGSALINGSKSAKELSTLTDYNTVDVGSLHATKGGRVVVTMDQSGNIKKHGTPVDASQLGLGVADHSNEDLIRKIHWREFGANRADDFSAVTTATIDVGFTLDDGTTTLVGDDVRSRIVQGEDLLGFASSTGDSFTLTFVGTGIDLEWAPSAIGTNTLSAQVQIDGVVLGNFEATVADLNIKIKKIVSGLPYGTHTMRIATPNSNVWAFEVKNFHIYGPKKPSISSDLVELADYNVMADYDSSNQSGITISDNQFIAQGVLTKNSMIEMKYDGTWSLGTPGVTTLSYFYPNTNTNGSSIEYTFFGTGCITHCIGGNETDIFSISIDGVLDNTGVALSRATNNGGGSYSNTSTTNYEPSRIEFTGLPLGLHTIKLTKTGGVNTSFQALHVITPIHINNTKVGSLGLLDSRELNSISTTEESGIDLSKAKAWVSYAMVTNRIVASYNIAAIIDDSVGVFQVFFEKPFKDSGYAGLGTATQKGTVQMGTTDGTTASWKIPGAIEVRNYVENAGALVLSDSSHIYVVFFGELQDEENE